MNFVSQMKQETAFWEKKETIKKTNSEHFIEKEVTKVLKQMTLWIVQIDNELSM